MNHGGELDHGPVRILRPAWNRVILHDERLEQRAKVSGRASVEVKLCLCGERARPAKCNCNITEGTRGCWHKQKRLEPGTTVEPVTVRPQITVVRAKSAEQGRGTS